MRFVRACCRSSQCSSASIEKAQTAVGRIWNVENSAATRLTSGRHVRLCRQGNAKRAVSVAFENDDNRACAATSTPSDAPHDPIETVVMASAAARRDAASVSASLHLAIVDHESDSTDDSDVRRIVLLHVDNDSTAQIAVLRIAALQIAALSYAHAQQQLVVLYDGGDAGQQGQIASFDTSEAEWRQIDLNALGDELLVDYARNLFAGDDIDVAEPDESRYLNRCCRFALGSLLVAHLALQRTCAHDRSGR